MRCTCWVCCLVPLVFALPSVAQDRVPASTAPDSSAFLDDLEHRCFQFFWDHTDPTTGLISDRAKADGSGHGSDASIAVDGFGLSALCVADERKWISHDEAYQRALRMIESYQDRVPAVHGFFYHWLKMETGERVKQSELSPIDTALLLAGMLTARAHFPNTELVSLVSDIYGRIDWPWMLNGKPTFAMSWRPETGFSPSRWDHFNEGPVLYLLALGSPTHPITPDCWEAWIRRRLIHYAGWTYIQDPPLFVQQYPQAWFDLRDQRDAHMDFWTNSRYATLAQRQFCIDIAKQFPGYGPNLWGITASSSADGYKPWGGPPGTTGKRQIDGSIVPSAPGGSVPFAPDECIAALQQMYTRFGDKVWTRYGLVDAFNPNTGWAAPEVNGLDQGITLLMIENQRSGLVWRDFMNNPEPQAAVQLAGFRRTRDPDRDGADQAYLQKLSSDTWHCIAALSESPGGLPYGTSAKLESAAAGDVGIYLNCVSYARAQNLISADEANTRIEKTLQSLEKLKMWHGFITGTVSSTDLHASPSDQLISTVDSATLQAALIAEAQAEPPFAARMLKLASAMDWSPFYDSRSGLLWDARNLASSEIVGQGHLQFLGGPGQMAMFLAVASGVVPPQMWDQLDRGFEAGEHVDYLLPGWNGGLSAQFTPAIWLDPGDTLMGRSAENLAYAQIRHGETTPAKVWGWSADLVREVDGRGAGPTSEPLSDDPLSDDRVAPCASVLAIEDFPCDVISNLKRLESLGARSAKDGFYDSVDLTNSKPLPVFSLHDQGLAFLSLGNYTQHDLLRKWFAANAKVQKGRAMLHDFAHPQFEQNSSYDLGAVVQQVQP